MEEKLARDVLDRLARLETKVDIVLGKCPPCQEKLHSHDITIADAIAKATAAHRRIDGIKKTAGSIAAAVVVILQAVISVAKLVMGG